MQSVRRGFQNLVARRSFSLVSTLSRGSPAPLTRSGAANVFPTLGPLAAPWEAVQTRGCKVDVVKSQHTQEGRGEATIQVVKAQHTQEGRGEATIEVVKAQHTQEGRGEATIEVELQDVDQVEVSSELLGNATVYRKDFCPTVMTTSHILNDGLAAMRLRHEQWMAEHGREYKDAVEKEQRFRLFKDEVEYIESANGDGDRKCTLGINKFADMTEEEIGVYYRGFKPKRSLGSAAAAAPTSFRYGNMSVWDLPPSVDWRTKGAVTGIKNQFRCGCCWSFAAIGATEGIIQIEKSTLIRLSEQQLVDCVYNFNRRGGDPIDAFEYMVHNGGISSEELYPYTAKKGKCNWAAPSVATINGYERVPVNNEAALLAAVAGQPVAVGIDSRGDFKRYTGGVLNEACKCGTDLNHGVTVVGYGTETDGTKYWLVKNSWGPLWGEGGYCKIQRDVAAVEGMCGIAMYASYPTVT